MHTTADISVLQMSAREDSAASAHQGLFRQPTRTVGKKDWDLVIMKADKLISGIGAMAIALSILYFAPVLLSIISR